ncbi:hypothetical protein NHX12_016078, partial [Muraenolepis orangiensis]
MSLSKDHRRVYSCNDPTTIPGMVVGSLSDGRRDGIPPTFHEALLKAIHENIHQPIHQPIPQLIPQTTLMIKSAHNEPVHSWTIAVSENCDWTVGFCDNAYVRGK